MLSLGVTGWGCVFAVCGILFSWVAAAIVASSRGSRRQQMTPCEYEHHFNYDPSIFVKPWNPGTPQLVMSITLVLTYATRALVIMPLAHWFMRDSPGANVSKVANYFLELLTTTALLLMTSIIGGGLNWDLLVHPDKFDGNVLSADQVYDLAVSQRLQLVIFVTGYVLEMATTKNMRASLQLHHWLPIGLTMWVEIILPETNYDPLVTRASFALSLFMSTEQCVFITMLMYRGKWFRYPILYGASAWFYVATRVFVTIVSIWSIHIPMMKYFVDHPISYTPFLAMILFGYPAIIVLNVVQFQTVQALFAIHKKVVRNRRWQASSVQKGKQHEEMVADAFDAIDYDNSGSISKDEWERYVRRLELGIMVPARTVAEVFDAMDSADGNGLIDYDEFRAYLIKYTGNADRIEEAIGSAVLSILSEDDTITDAERQLAKYVQAGIKKKEFRVSSSGDTSTDGNGQRVASHNVFSPIHEINLEMPMRIGAEDNNAKESMV
eukprot:m.202339 g.202339  ORF g.202339 m.202339 type:complete len:495 (+) comp18825_c0_seq1:116-1600(+)